MRTLCIFPSTIPFIAVEMGGLQSLFRTSQLPNCLPNFCLLKWALGNMKIELSSSYKKIGPR